MILSFFLLTFEYRENKIKNIIIKNSNNLMLVIRKFREKIEDE